MIPLRHFNPREFDSPDAPGSGELMQTPFLEKLDEIRHRCDFRFVIASGYRTEAHNMEVGGVDGSAHTKGWAVDIAVNAPWQRFLVVKHSVALGINRIGIGGRFVHIDTDPDLPQNQIWTY